MKQKKRKSIQLTAPDAFQWASKTAAEIIRVCKENDVELSPQYEKLIKLLQVPEVERSMLARLLEIERIFNDEITEFFKNGYKRIKNI